MQGVNLGKYEERIGLLERDVEQLKTDQAQARSAHQAVKEEHENKIAALMREMAALKAATGITSKGNNGKEISREV